MRKRIQREGIAPLRAAVLASRSDSQFAKKEPFRRRRMQRAFHDADQGGFIAARSGRALRLGSYRSHSGMIMAQWDFAMASRREDEWVWGWDSTPGIVSVWADLDGRATVWRRIPKTGALVRE